MIMERLFKRVRNPEGWQWVSFTRDPVIATPRKCPSCGRHELPKGKKLCNDCRLKHKLISTRKRRQRYVDKKKAQEATT